MYNCELFSIRKSKSDHAELDAAFDSVAEKLREAEVDVKFKTDLSADAEKLADALDASTENGEIELYLFANALNTPDSSSFKKLFYEYITRTEATLEPDGEHPNASPKLKIFSLGDMGNGYKGYCFKLYNKLFIALPYASLAKKPQDELLLEGVDKARDVVNRNYEKYPAGIAYPDEETSGDADDADAKGAKKNPKKKEGFFRSFIPHKGDSRASVIRKIVVLLAIVVFIGALIYVINFFFVEPAVNNSINDEIREIAYNNEPTSPTTPDGKPSQEQDWKALKKLNEEIVGWIRLDDSPIDYPVMWHEGDDQYSQYYLNHTYKHEWSAYGTVFIDYRSKQVTDSKNVIMHGHNMLDGSMFHELMNYSDRFEGDLDYFRDHCVFTFNTPKGDAKWKVISVFKTSTLYDHGEFFNYMQGEFLSPAEFMNFVYNVRIRSMFNVPVMVNEDDQIMTLSTCSYEYTNFRTVLVARKVRPGEDPTVDIKHCSVNHDPFLPEVCYSGARPDPLTFKKAYKQGKINWYDGKYDGKDNNKLKGSEVLTATVAANPTEPPTAKDGETAAPANRRVFNVTYVNMDGSQFAAYSVFEGDPVPIPEGHPTYDDPNYTYTFAGWDMDVEGVDFQHLNTSINIAPKFNYTPK